MKTKPAPAEYAPSYEKYISLVPEADILTVLAEQLDSTLSLLRGIPEERSNHRYAPGKWSIKELVGHLIDSERVFSYRALRIACNDKTPLPGFEQDDYVANANFDARRLADLADEFEQVRKSNLQLFKPLEDAAWLRMGVANNTDVSVRALAFIIAGHAEHHLSILRTRYL